MQSLLIGLAIANMVVVVAVGTTVAAQVKRTEKRIDHMDEELKKVSANGDLGKLKVELKEHISKEFLAMAFRGIKLK